MDEGFSPAASSPAPAPTSAPSSTPASSPAPSTAPSPAPSGSPSQESHSTPQQHESNVVAQSRTEGGYGRQQLIVDQFGRRVVKVNNNNSASEPTPQQTPPPSMGGAGQQQEPQGVPFTGDLDSYIRENNIQPNKYTLDEFSSALASGNIDERRVPDQYKARYEAFKIDQAVEQYNANQRAIEAQKKAEVEQQLTPEQRTQNMTEFYSSLDKEAGLRAQQDVGLTPEDIEDLPYMDATDPKLINYNLAKDFHKQQLMGDLQRRAAEDEARRIRQENTYREINNFVNEARIKEPNFDPIDVLMKERYKSLPYEQGQRIATVINAMQNGSITDEQLPVLKEYYENCRREYYAKQNGLSTTPQQKYTPPIVERAGGNDAPPAQYAPDYNALRNASGPRERRAWVLQFMRANANRNR